MNKYNLTDDEISMVLSHSAHEFFSYDGNDLACTKCRIEGALRGRPIGSLIEHKESRVCNNIDELALALTEES